ncbi:MAG TPA: NAD(P)-dependent oxidoreductase [bacterium]|nr:NAD(P)-dependent oxidoreductase [bacterium]
MKRRILITGGEGFAAREIVAVLGDKYSVTPVSRAECDVTDAGMSKRTIEFHRPDVVIHTAAMVDKVKCEFFPETARKINADSVLNIAGACAEAGAKFVFISSDFIFDGKKTSPYLESDEAAPINVYGKTKSLGERYALEACQRALVVRTSRMFGTRGGNFISMLPGLLKIENNLNVATDTISNITYARDFATALVRLIENDRQGVFHVVNEGECSTYDFAEHLSGMIKTIAVLHSVTHDLFLPGVDVPRYCGLASERAGEAPEVLLRHWKDAARDFFLAGDA